MYRNRFITTLFICVRLFLLYPILDTIFTSFFNIQLVNIGKRSFVGLKNSQTIFTCHFTTFFLTTAFYMILLCKLLYN